MEKDFMQFHFMNHGAIMIADPVRHFEFCSVSMVKGSLIDKYKEKYSHLDLPENFTIEEYQELETYIKENEFKSIII